MNRIVLVVCLLSFLLRSVAAVRGWQLSRSQSPAWHQLGPDSFGRAALLARLQNMRGRQLVIVHYTPEHDLFDEWVYNDADIENSKVVWARDMGAIGDSKLMSYFKDRYAWRLDPDGQPPKLSPLANSRDDANAVRTEIPVENGN